MRETLNRTAPGRSLEPRASAVGLRWVAGFFYLLLAIPVLVVPHRLADTPYGALTGRPFLAGSFLLLAGSGLLAVSVLPVRRFGRALADLAGSVAGFALAASHYQTAGSAGFLAMAALGLGQLLSLGAGAPASPQAGRPARRIEALVLVVAATAIGQGLVALGTPAGLAPAWAGLVRPLWLAPLLLAAGVLLTMAQFASLPRSLRAMLHLLAGWGVAAYGAAAALPLPDVPLAVWLVGAGVTSALWPFLAPRLERGGATTLTARVAWALTAAAVLPLLLAVGAITDQVERMAQKQAEAGERRAAEALAQSVRDAVDLHRLHALSLANRAAALPFDPAPQGALLTAGRAAAPDLDTLLLLDADGRLIGQAGPGTIGEDQLRQLAGDGGPQALHVGEDAAGQPLIWVSSPVPAEPPQRPAILVSVLRPDTLAARLERPGMDVALTDGDRRLLAARRAALPAGVSPAAEPAGAPPRTVASVPDLGWRVEVAGRRADALAGVEAGRELAFFLLLAFLPLAALVAAGAARRFSSPLAQLTDAAEATTAGEPWAPPRRATGEVGRLASAFRELNDRLARRTQESERLAAELRARAEALADSDRRKNEFLAMLAHELRNPIGAVSTASYVVSQAGIEKGPAARAVAIIERQVHHLSRLVDDLLDVSRITRGKIELRREEVDLGDLVSHAVEACLPLAQAKEQTLAWTQPAEPVPFYGDGTRLEQAFANLIRNAIKFTPAKGKIEVDLHREAEEIRVAVRDDGVGIPADLLPRIFDLFTQGKQGLDRSVGGLGIGLTLVRSLVEMHGGKVEARSEGTGRGAEFVVHLPLVPTSVRTTADLDSSAVWAR